MGIKGIYGEIGPGERIALSKLAIEKFEQSRRPLRIAIDVSIWQFQTQAGQGGSNPALRTFYYRLLRLLSVSVQPLFVFDGPHKPPFKRGKKTGKHGAMVSNLLTKQVLKLFGFPFHMAPGEAEAECALLQKEGIVDAVLSEDVDTLMFGCGLTLRNWSSEGSRGRTAPTHISVYDAKITKEGKAGLDREGMVLVALMSGGDYITEGIPGCGIKVACEAARAGYGKSLCKLSRLDTAGLAAWRAGLAHEIQTNESRYFRIKHKSLKIPEDFPNREVLGYYTHPVVSSASKVQKLKDEITWDGEVDVQGLRLFVAEAFEWTHRIGARKFIRVLAPALLVHKLRLRGDRRDSGYGDIVLTAINELELVRAICGQRTHFSTDGMPELRVVYRPLDIVGIDLNAEVDDSEDYGRDGLAPLGGDDQIEAYASDDPSAGLRSANSTKRAASVYDPTQPDKLWIPQTIAKLGIPLKVEDYEESLRDPKNFLKQKAAAKRAAIKGGMPKGALDRFVKVLRPAHGIELASTSKPLTNPAPVASQPALPPVFLAPTLERFTSSPPATHKNTRSGGPSATISTESTATKPKTKPKSRKTKDTSQTGPNANPWTLSRPSPLLHVVPNITKPLSQVTKSSSSQALKHTQYNTINLVSSFPAPRSSPPPMPRTLTPGKHKRSPTPPSSHGSDGGEDEPDFPPLLSTVTRIRGSRPVDKSLRTPSSAEGDSDRPSLKKKHSSTSSSSSEGMNDRRQSVRSMPEPLSPEPIARILDFQTQRARSSSPALPTITELVSPVRVTRNDVIALSSSPPVFRNQRVHTKTGSPAAEKKAKGKKVFMLRESIGGWEELDEGQFAEQQKGRRKRQAFRESQVEILDLCGDSSIG